MKITDDIKKVLEWMSEETGYFYPKLEEETGLTRKELQKIMKNLKIAGYCEWVSFINCDGETGGSGHVLTEKGARLQSELGIEYKGEYISC